MATLRTSKIVLSAFLLCTTAGMTGCKKSGSATATTLPAEPTYENPFDQFKDIPNQVNAKIDWVKQPLADASALGEEFSAIQAKYSLDVKTLGGMCSAAFVNGKIEISADASIAADAKADIEAFLGKVKAAGEGVLSIPKRVSTAAGAIGKMTLKIPGVAMKATTHLKGELKAATDDAKVQIQANLEMIPKLTGEFKAMIPDAMGKVKAIPGEAAGTITELKAAFAGEGSFPKIAGGASASAGGEAGGEASAEGSAEGSAETPAEAPAEAPAAE
jgi:hypothetical protein